MLFKMFQITIPHLLLFGKEIQSNAQNENSIIWSFPIYVFQKYGNFCEKLSLNINYLSQKIEAILCLLNN